MHHTHSHGSETDVDTDGREHAPCRAPTPNSSREKGKRPSQIGRLHRMANKILDFAPRAASLDALLGAGPRSCMEGDRVTRKLVTLIYPGKQAGDWKRDIGATVALSFCPSGPQRPSHLPRCAPQRMGSSVTRCWPTG